ncbi:uncharacterized protein LOC144743421 [Ciona intestinalis]
MKEELDIEKQKCMETEEQQKRDVQRYEVLEEELRKDVQRCKEKEDELDEDGGTFKEREENLERDIYNCKKVTLTIGQKENIIGHTALIVLIDRRPKYSIDFGVSGSLSSSAAMKSPCKETIGVNYYDDNDWGEITEIVWEMKCLGDEEKEKAIRLLKN